MFKRIRRGRFTERYLPNLFIILFSVGVVDSLIESDVSDRIGNTTATLRLTRQKVLIQAIERPENRGERRLTRDDQTIDNQYDYAPPDIVVEEFRIRAKINLPTRRRPDKGDTKSLPFLETQNNELEKPEKPTISSDFGRKMAKRSTINNQMAQPCHGKSTLNVTSYLAQSQLQKARQDERLESQIFSKKSYDKENGSERRSRRSLKSPNNSTSASKNDSPKKVPKKSTNANKKKKTKLEKLSKKSQSESTKSSTRKTRNLTKAKTKLLQKRSNNTIWDSSGPAAINAYFNFFSTLFSPMVQEVKKNLSMKKKNQSVSENNSTTFNSVSTPNTAKSDTSNSTTIGIPNSRQDETPGATKNRASTSTEIYDKKTPEVRFKTEPEIRFQNLKGNNSSYSTATNFPDVNKIGTDAVTKVQENLQTAEAKNTSLRILTSSTTEFVPKDSADNSTPRQTSDSTAERKIYETSSSPLKDNDAKLSEIAISVMKMMENPAENFTKISGDATSDKPGDYHEKTTLNFTIIDPNCTESVLLNSLRNGSANPTSSIAAEVMSTYPTLRRYSRNDTADEVAKIKILDVRGNETKNPLTKNSSNDSNPPGAVRRAHGGNRGRKRSRYKGKMQHSFSANLLPRVNAKQSWRAQNKLPVMSSTSLATTTTELASTTEIADLLDFTENKKSTLPPVLGGLLELTLPTLAISVDRQHILTNASIAKSAARDDSTQLLQNEKIGVSVPTKIFTSEIDLRPIGTTTTTRNEFLENKKPEVTTLSATETTNSTATDFNNGIRKETSFHVGESKTQSDVINEVPRNKFIEVSTLPYKSTSADFLMIKKMINLSTKDVGSKSSQLLEKSKAEETESLNILRATITPSSIVPAGDESSSSSGVESTVTSVKNQIELPRKPAEETGQNISSRNEEQKVAINLTGKPETSTVSEQHQTQNISESRKTGINSNGTNHNASTWEYTKDVDLSAVTKNPDLKKSPTAVKLPRTARKTRDTSAQYEESQEPELDYDIDGFLGDETTTKVIQKMREDNGEGSTGASTPKNSPFPVDLPHSVVHRVFFEEDNKPGVESTMIPTNHRLRDYQSLPASTVASTNSVNFFNEISPNLTNFLEEPELLALVNGLEDFLFDDSATGTFARKLILPKNQDLDAESSNQNTETRSAIFKTKRLSVNKRTESKSTPKNWTKRKSAKSTTKRGSDVSSSGKRIKSKIGKTPMKRKKMIVTKKKSSKAGKSKVFPAKKAPSKSRRASGKGRNSTEKVSVNKWKSEVTRK